MGKSASGKRYFARDIIIASFAVSLLAIGAVTYLAMKARQDTSERYIESASSLAMTEFRLMQSTISASLGIVRDYGISGVVSLSQPETLKNQLLPIFKNKSMISGITVADTNGRSYLILSDGTERLPSASNDFDPLTRPWFKPALQTDEVYWTEQYEFHTLKKIGITASASFQPKKGNGSMVVAFDVLLDDFFSALEQLAPSENSELFLFRNDELLLIPESEEQSSSFTAVHSISNSLVSTMHRLWKNGSVPEKEAASFLHDGKVWWCGFQPLEGSREDIWMGVVVPESDIIDDISRRWFFLWAFGLVFILLSVGMAFWLTRRYGRSLVEPPSLNDEQLEVEAQKLIASGENRMVEFKSTMRMNLHAKKPGKEIEIAWLKGIAGFLNTDGGTLLIGVTDDGKITGLELDVFENEDKCRLHFKNLVANHLGPEISTNIRLHLIKLEEKTVGVVKCISAAHPVFLKNGNKEAFYIRNGPSSDELPVSKVVDYIKEKWG